MLGRLQARAHHVRLRHWHWVGLCSHRGHCHRLLSHRHWVLAHWLLAHLLMAHWLCAHLLMATHMGIVHRGENWSCSHGWAPAHHGHSLGLSRMVHHLVCGRFWSCLNKFRTIVRFFMIRDRMLMTIMRAYINMMSMLIEFTLALLVKISIWIDHLQRRYVVNCASFSTVVITITMNNNGLLWNITVGFGANLVLLACLLISLLFAFLTVNY